MLCMWWRCFGPSMFLFVTPLEPNTNTNTQEDGSVLINHYGCEVGQGIHVKVIRAVN